MRNNELNQRRASAWRHQGYDTVRPSVKSHKLVVKMLPATHVDLTLPGGIYDPETSQLFTSTTHMGRPTQRRHLIYDDVRGCYQYQPRKS